MTADKPQWSLEDLAKKMRDLDFCLLSTKAADGTVASRPMSNNREVAFDGDTWFFTDTSARLVDEIAAEPQVGLGFQGKAGVLGLRPLFITIEGRAELIRDKGQFVAHWTTDLERWWPDGIDTPGLVLIRVAAERAHYWDGEEEGEITLASGRA